MRIPYSLHHEKDSRESLDHDAHHRHRHCHRLTALAALTRNLPSTSTPPLALERHQDAELTFGLLAENREAMPTRAAGWVVKSPTRAGRLILCG